MVNEKLQKIRPALVIRKGVKSHTSKMTQEKIKELQWEVLPHPPYSPDLPPSYFHSFRSMEHFLRNQKFKSLDDVDFAVSQYIDLKIRNYFAMDSINYLHVGKKSLTAMEIISLNNYCYLCVI